MTYITSNFSQQKHAFVWSDFWEYTKKYFWKGFLLSLILTLLFYLYINAFVFYMNSGMNKLLILIVEANIGLFLMMVSFYAWLITDHDDECEWIRYINYLINWAFENSYSEDKDISPLGFTEWKNKPGYTWKDIVCINGVFYAEEFEISGEMDDETHYRIDNFLEAVARKHGVDTDDVMTYMMDNIDFNPQQMPYGAEACGCYINGKPEWCQKN